MKTSYSDRARSLQYPSEITERKNLLAEPQIKPLTDFVDRIRKECGRRYDIPYFDPCDGGIQARALFLLEAPGPKAIKSGFVSRNNDDKSAENMLRFLKQAGLSREDSILWNIVPWYLGDGDKIRAATAQDIKEGLVYLSQLLEILINLRALVLVGGKAQQGISNLKLDSEIQLFDAMHPSQRVLNLHSDADERILAVFKDVSAYLSDL